MLLPLLFLLGGLGAGAGDHMAQKKSPAYANRRSALMRNLFNSFGSLRTQGEKQFRTNNIQRTPGFQNQTYGKPLVPPRPPRTPSMYR